MVDDNLANVSSGISMMSKAGAEMITGTSASQSFGKIAYQQTTYSTVSKLPLSFRSQLDQIEQEIRDL